VSAVRISQRPPDGRAPWTLAAAADRAGGVVNGGDVAFRGVGTDTRKDLSGRLFVALRGERFDGHDFARAARDQGAVALLVDHPVDLALPQWVVEDTRIALGRLAAAHRDAFAGRIVAVTGSNGKTTCKEMIAAVLGQVGRVRATSGNLNNDIGMPLTLLEAGEEDFLVLEMGANHAGEIAYLTGIARPDVAVITNAGRAHLEGFGSLEGVARAKGEIALGLPPEGTFIVPSDSPWTVLWRGLADGRTLLTCGPDDGAAVRCARDGVHSRWDEEGFRTELRAEAGGRTLELALPLAGVHNARNAMMAVAVALALDIPAAAVQAGLAAMRPVPGRLFPRLGPGGLRVIDDTYNANPDSVLAAIDVLVGLAGRHLLVLGDLAELGPEAAELHRQLGAAARDAGVDALYTVGALSGAAAQGFGAGARHFEEQAGLIAALRADVAAPDLVLIKGSRRSAMDRVADDLCGGGGA
jgi:UDP-N-acetylmuramoyl-tripeptide--D-alanyl-D-alanine ligase